MEGIQKKNNGKIQEKSIIIYIAAIFASPLRSRL